MNAAGISNIREFTEDIEIGYYSNAKIELRDPVGQLKAMFPWLTEQHHLKHKP